MPENEITENEIIAVIGWCAPERTRYATALAESTQTRVVEFSSTVLAGEIPAVCDRQHTELLDIVCVIDAPHLLRDLGTLDDMTCYRPWGKELMSGAHVAMGQIEHASTLVVVQWDSLTTADLSTLLALLSHLAPLARLRLDRPGALSVSRGAVTTPVARFDRPGWVDVLGDALDPHMTDARVSAVHYAQVRPFHAGRLAGVLDEQIEPGRFGTVVRSSGFCRFATRDRSAQWEHVGGVIGFAPLPADGTSARADADEWNESGYIEPLAIGQDLAFIGLDLDPAGLCAALDTAALTDAELEAGPDAWSHYDDPYPAWAPARGSAG